jgi:hypothetical protein
MAAGSSAAAAAPRALTPPLAASTPYEGDLADTGLSTRPYLLLGVGMVLIGLVMLVLALMIGPKKARRRF